MLPHSQRRRPLRVVVVGGGAAGVITAVHLLESADPVHPVEVHVVERDARIGPGLAYRTTDPWHLLNNFAGRLHALEGRPDHLLRWCLERGYAVGPQSFLPRHLYGDYLADLLDHATVPFGSRLHRHHGEVVDLAGGAVVTGDGACVEGDVVVLALGNPPPDPGTPYAELGDHYLPDPWVADLTGRSPQRVLLVGTGLTMVDVVATLSDQSPTTTFTAVSRHGLLPRPHVVTGPRLIPEVDVVGEGLDALTAAVRARIDATVSAGGDWRDVVDGLRVRANALWASLSPDDQERFAVELARTWDVVRHRMAPRAAGRIASLRREGRLQLARPTEVRGRFDLVVNCTGPVPVPTRGWNPLVDHLLDAGIARPHRLGLGLDLTPEGRLVDAHGQAPQPVYAVGAARRGLEWEVTAIPDLRLQAVSLATHLLGRSARSDASSVAGAGTPGA